MEAVKNIVLAVTALFVLLAITGCCEDPWEAYPTEEAPDRSCRTGSVEGYDVYIWKCRDDQREVVYRYSAEMSCDEPEKETVSCGERTPIEEELGDKIGPDCESVPSSMEWQVTSPSGWFGLF